MASTHTTIRGYIGSNPEPIRSKESNEPVGLSFRVATTDRYRDANGNWVDSGTDWFTVKSWGNLAENALYSLHKGDPIIASGRLRMETWSTAEGMDRCAMVLTASALGPDLNVCTVLRRPSLQQERRKLQETESESTQTSAASSTYQIAESPDEGAEQSASVNPPNDSEPVF